MNIFEKAIINKVRFNSDRGQLTTEQLYDLPLTSLDKMAREVNSQLKGLEEESFVDLKPNPEKASLSLQLDLLKAVIKTQLDKVESSKKAQEKAQKRKVLLEALEAKQNAEILSMSVEDIQKSLEEL